MRQILAGDRIVIGRGEDCDLQLQSARASRHHLEIGRNTLAEWEARDLNSRNGTMLNGVALVPAPAGTALRPGDVLTVGEFELRFLLLQERVGSSTDTGSNDTEKAHTTWHSSSPSAHVTRLQDLPPAPRDDALPALARLGERLLELPEAHDRMQLLCEVLNSAAAGASSACVIEVQTGNLSSAPVVIAGPNGVTGGTGSADGADPSQAISREAITAALSAGHAVLFSDADWRAVICPLRVRDTSADFLLARSTRLGDVNRLLVVVALAVEQFKKVQLQLDSRNQNSRSAAIEHDLAMARSQQMSLIPRRPAQLGLDVAIGFEPCGFIAGDLVLVMPVPIRGDPGETAGTGSAKVLLLVGDVSGHGPAAALVAAGIHSLAQSAVRGGATLEQLTLQLNEYLLQSADRQSFCTTVSVLIDPATGAMELVNAGHPPVLVIDPAGQVRQVGGCRNLPLGVVAADFLAEQDRLEPGELLVLFTDGLSEIWTGGGATLLGVDALSRHIGSLYRQQAELPLDRLRDLLNDLLRQLQSEESPADDQTFLLARRSVGSQIESAST